MNQRHILPELERLAEIGGKPADLPRQVAEQLAKHPTYPRTCLSCGARESLDGSVPCGH